MPKKNGEAKTNRGQRSAKTSGPNDGEKDAFSVWTEGYNAMSKLWQESYVNMYNPWIESAGKLFERAADLSKEASPDKYRDFFSELVKTQQSSLGKLYPMPKTVTDKETLEKVMNSAQESANLMKKWSKELEDNSKKTQEMLLSGPEPEKYRQFYSMWTDSYEKIFEGFLEMMTSKNTKDMFESYMGIPNIYLTSMAETARMWKDSYKNLYTPWTESTFELYEKFAELSKGGATPEKYREFYDQWMDTYRETFAKMFTVEFGKPSKDMVSNMIKSMDTSMEMYRSWLTTLEATSGKLKDLMSDSSNPEAYKEYFELWISTYEKAYDDFFEYLPVLEPLRNLLEPMKSAARIQSETYARATRMWMEAVLGKKAE
jgi:hypothetical protein